MKKYFVLVMLSLILFAFVACGYSDADLSAAYESGYQEGSEVARAEASDAYSDGYDQGFEDGLDESSADDFKPDFAFSSDNDDSESDTTVYWVPNGTRYHSSPDCRTLSRSKTIYEGTLDDAFAAGIDTPCKVCY